eukprot:PLAT5033.1.p1 GENE.PLAT5033.1~~PLAT5033.1.p1  ORF type:complete len:361 (-),score=170.81 PLAT5033.1:241-1323(-)
MRAAAAAARPTLTRCGSWTAPPRNVLLTGKPQDAGVAAVLAAALRQLDAAGARALLPTQLLPAVPHDCRHCVRAFDYDTPADELEAATDLAISIGGDGAALWAAALFAAQPPPLCAVAMGNVGFLTHTPPTHLPALLDAALRGQQLPVSDADRLRVQLLPAAPPALPADATADVAVDADVPSFFAVNEVAITRGLLEAPLALQVCAAGSSATGTTLTADGLLLSTASGSTAYSMSAGGPMVHPACNALLLTPVCAVPPAPPPLLLPLHTPLDIVLTSAVPSESKQVGAVVDVDARTSFTLPPQQRLRLCGDASPLRLLSSPLQSSSGAERTSGWLNDIQEMLSWNHAPTARRKPPLVHEE